MSYSRIMNPVIAEKFQVGVIQSVEPAPSGSLTINGSLYKIKAPHLWGLAMYGLTKDFLSTELNENWILNDNADILDYLLQSKKLVDACIRELKSTPGFAANTEQDLSNKLTWQKGGPFGWQVIGWPSSVISNPKQAKPLARAAASLMNSFHFSSPNPEMHGRYPRLTNHGWPDFGNSDQSLIVHALIGSLSLKGIKTFEQYCASLMGVPPVIWTFSRTGPISKPQPHVTELVFTDETVTAKWNEVRRGFSPRRRVVLGVPSYRNIHLSGMMHEIKNWLMMQPWSAVGKSFSWIEQHFAHFTNRTLLSDDLSSWDQSIAFETLDSMSDVLHSRGLSQEEAMFWRGTEDMGVGIGSGNGMFIRENKGGITSGIITTSVMGSILNASRIETLILRLGLARDDIDYLVLGDDAIISVASSAADLLQTEWNDANRDLGFTSNLSRDPVFLMRQLLSETSENRLAGIPLLARSMQQIGCPERRRRPGSDEFAISISAKMSLLYRWCAFMRPKLSDPLAFIKARFNLPSTAALEAIAWDASRRVSLSGTDKVLRDAVASAEHSPVGAMITAFLPDEVKESFSVEVRDLLQYFAAKQDSDKLQIILPLVDRLFETGKFEISKI